MSLVMIEMFKRLKEASIPLFLAFNLNVKNELLAKLKEPTEQHANS